MFPIGVVFLVTPIVRTRVRPCVIIKRRHRLNSISAVHSNIWSRCGRTRRKIPMKIPDTTTRVASLTSIERMSFDIFIVIRINCWFVIKRWSISGIVSTDNSSNRFLGTFTPSPKIPDQHFSLSSTRAIVSPSPSRTSRHRRSLQFISIRSPTANVIRARVRSSDE